MMMHLHTFYNEDRKAEVFSVDYGFRIDQYIGSKKVGDINIADHSEQYAEDAAENWVMEWGQFAKT